MAETRRGAMTPEQQKILDELLKWKSGAAEAVDGLGIQLVDDIGIEALLKKADEANPEIRSYVYQVVDLLFEGLAALSEKD